jgi:NAD(P)H dehydrogenase (quinone)
MAKILIVYDSKTGNTEAMAKAVTKGVKKTGKIEVTVKKAEETTNKDLLGADGIIMGSPTYFGQMSAKLKAVVDESVKIHGELTGKVGALLQVAAELRQAAKPHYYPLCRRCLFTA